MRFLEAGVKGGYEPPVTDAGPLEEQKEPLSTEHVSSPWSIDFAWMPRTFSWEMTIFFTNSAGKATYAHVKEMKKNRPLPYTTWEKKPNAKSVTAQT